MARFFASDLRDDASLTVLKFLNLAYYFYRKKSLRFCIFYMLEFSGFFLNSFLCDCEVVLCTILLHEDVVMEISVQSYEISVSSLYVSGISDKPFLEYRKPHYEVSLLHPPLPYGMGILYYYQTNMVFLPFRITSNSVLSLNLLKTFSLRGEFWNGDSYSF